MIDDSGRQLVHFEQAGQQCPEQLLITVKPGFSYELRYKEAPTVPVMQSARDLPILTLALAARANALLVHACALLLGDGSGVLCPGVSGSGKSTLARLLSKAGAPVELLSDDRVVLTAREGDLRIWGTPWPGDAFAASERDGALRAIVFFARGKVRAIRALRPAEAARRLFSLVGMVVWDPSMVEQALSVVDRAVCGAPVYEATYEPTIESARWLVTTLEDEMATHD